MASKKIVLTNGLFISFEGGEGVGKTTQVNLLYDRLVKAGYISRVFREPGGTKISEQVRLITHDLTNTMLDDRAEALLFAASRAQLVAEVYQPLIAKGGIVIADRYVDSSYVYQGIARGLGYLEIKKINEFATGGLMPDITFLFDLDYQLGSKRRQGSTKIDRIDMEKESFHKAVYEGYHQIAKDHVKRITVVDASRTILEIHQEIWDTVNKLIERQAIG